MARVTANRESGRDEASETYAVGYNDEVVGFFSERGASKQAGFSLPYLRPGMRLLDCGCGPGTITVDLAALVAPGAAVGIDREPRQIDAARAHSARAGLGIAQFEVASVYQLPFSEETFDVAFAHGVLEHLADPVAALRKSIGCSAPAD